MLTSKRIYTPENVKGFSGARRFFVFFIFFLSAESRREEKSAGGWRGGEREGREREEMIIHGIKLAASPAATCDLPSSLCDVKLIKIMIYLRARARANLL